ncbi:MAG: helix-turn-helix domain-containing protein [Beijerinckiaceae bacterium]|nr:helix-turn-helix domain-containing protein [Beijerinckiaceae bacterium]
MYTPTKVPDPVDAHVGKRIKARRFLLGLTQSDLAAWLGLSFQQIQKYEKGMNRIGAARLNAIADRLGVDVGYFYEGAPPSYALAETSPATRNESCNIDRLMSSPEGLALVKAFMKIDSVKDRQILVAMAHTLSSLPKTAAKLSCAETADAKCALV